VIAHAACSIVKDKFDVVLEEGEDVIGDIELPDIPDLDDIRDALDKLPKF